jgi:hypothetical protein
MEIPHAKLLALTLFFAVAELGLLEGVTWHFVRRWAMLQGA